MPGFVVAQECWLCIDRTWGQKAKIKVQEGITWAKGQSTQRYCAADGLAGFDVCGGIDTPAWDQER